MRIWTPTLSGRSRRQGGWRPLFGQTGPAQGHLRSQGVGPGDLFLFFGLFRCVEQGRGGWRFVRRSPARHVLWGWLQVGELHAIDSLAADALPWALPPALPRRPQREQHPVRRGQPPVSARQTHQRSGAGVFPRIDASLVLTAPDAAGPSQWQLPAGFFPSQGRVPLSHHGKPGRWRLIGEDRCFLQSVYRGQEFVLDLTHYPAVTEWAAHLLGA